MSSTYCYCYCYYVVFSVVLCYGYLLLRMDISRKSEVLSPPLTSVLGFFCVELVSFDIFCFFTDDFYCCIG